jgi:hypothetical protein
MPEGYKIFQTKNIIKKIEKSKLNIENFRKLIKELANASAVHQDHNLVIDIREIEPLKNYSQVLEIIIEASKYQHTFTNRIAVIIANEPDRIARAKFFKAGLKPGKYLFEYFTDYEKAIEWLSDIYDQPDNFSVTSN